MKNCIFKCTIFLLIAFNCQFLLGECNMTAENALIHHESREKAVGICRMTGTISSLTHLSLSVCGEKYFLTDWLGDRGTSGL